MIGNIDHQPLSERTHLPTAVFMGCSFDLPHISSSETACTRRACESEQLPTARSKH